jgi:hypothetical protein
MGYTPNRSGGRERASNPFIYRCNIPNQAPVEKKHEQRLTAFGNWDMAFFRHCRESLYSGFMDNNFERS